MKITVFLSGPISNGETLPVEEIEKNVQNAIDVADELLKEGFYPFVPHLTWFWHKQKLDGEYESWMDYAFVWLEKCKVLLRLPGDSAGADREVEYAKEKKIPVLCSVEEVLFWAGCL